MAKYWANNLAIWVHWVGREREEKVALEKEMIVKRSRRFEGSSTHCSDHCLIFGHLQQWKFDQQHLKFAKISSNVAKYLINPYKWPKFFNLVPKWRKFDKSGHIEFICHGLFLFICVFAKQCESNWINGDTKNGQKGVWTVDLYYLRRPLNRLSQIQWPSDNAKREHCDKL